MSSIKENNKLGNRNQQHSNSGSTLTTSTSTNQTLKREQGNNNNTREEATAKRTKRRTTKVGLNDTLRRIRQLMVEGRNNSEIQDILQLEERTFYRYMAKIYEIDQALFAEQEKKTIKTEMSILKDRLLKAYRWCIAMADNENIKEDTRMQAQNLALEVAAAVLRLEAQGP
jgi:DNA-binding CsgD family transcriptional regulator